MWSSYVCEGWTAHRAMLTSSSVAAIAPPPIVAIILSVVLSLQKLHDHLFRGQQLSWSTVTRTCTNLEQLWRDSRIHMSQFALQSTKGSAGRQSRQNTELQVQAGHLDGFCIYLVQKEILLFLISLFFGDVLKGTMGDIFGHNC